MPPTMPISSSVAARSCGGPMSSGCGADDDHPVEPPNLPLEREKRTPRATLEQGAARDELAADAGRAPRSRRRSSAVGEARSSRRSPASPSTSSGSRTTPTATSRPRSARARPRRPRERSPGRPPSASTPIRLPSQPVADQRPGRRRSANSCARSSSPLRSSARGAGVLEVAGEALLEVLLGVGEDVAAEPGADQDADREREEDRDQRGRVVAGAIAQGARS